MRPKLLILGGTTEASALAALAAERGVAATLSYAGRVESPRRQPVPTRSGGFGGAAGLAAWLRGNQISHVVDATHPFAAQMSRNAVAACAEAGVPLVALVRAPWTAVPGDQWSEVPDVLAAAAALAGRRRRVFLAVGRQSLGAFATWQQHRYLLRLVDPPSEPPPFRDHAVVVSRGPFTELGDRDLLREHHVDIVVCKNSGGSGARAKVDAARVLGLPVVMIARPAMPERAEVTSPEAVLDWLAAVRV